MKLNWKQERISPFDVAKRLGQLNLHPGYFHLLQDGIMVILVYLELPELEQDKS